VIILLFQIIVLGISIFFLYNREMKLRDIYSKLPSESEILELESEMREILYELKDSLRKVKSSEADKSKVKVHEIKEDDNDQEDLVNSDVDSKNNQPKSLEQNGVYDSVIELFYKGLSEVEISKKLNLPRGKVDLILSLEKLKKRL